MKKVSDKMKLRLAKYKKLCEADAHIQACKRCGITGGKNILERHHPHRRLGDNLYNYIYLCTTCHAHVEITSDPEYLVRDNSTEQKFHKIKTGENFLRQ